VAYASATPGAYAQERVMPADRVVKIPEGVSDRLAAAAMLKGLTARFLVRQTHRVRKGETVVVHAAAGGVGLIVAQWARHLGATVIGVVGSDAKAAVALQHGCHHALVLGRDDLAARVREQTGGLGAHCLRPLGMMVTYGNASGPVAPVAPLELAKRGSLFLTRPILFHYIARRADLERAARELFEVIGQGVVRIEIGQSYALQDVAQAHRDLEARRTVGSTVLIP
jgi:NADPH2:quinone reductase